MRVPTLVWPRTGDDWTECFTSYGTVLPLAPYVGFTALTGDVSDAHECVPSFYSLPYAFPSAQNAETLIDHPTASSA